MIRWFREHWMCVRRKIQQKGRIADADDFGSCADRVKSAYL